jgi:hypothetical protein
MQVQASGFAENLHPPLSDSIFCKKPAYTQTLPFSATKTTTTEPMERRINLKWISTKKKNEMNSSENQENENKTPSPPESA